MSGSNFEILEIMIIKLLIISVILVAIVMLGLGVKLLFNPDAEFSAHSCALEDGSLDKDGACSKCQMKESADCPENKDKIESYYGNGTLKHDHSGHSHNSDNESKPDIKYKCPMKCEGDKTYDAPGRCPVCNMKLLPVDDKNQETKDQ